MSSYDVVSRIQDSRVACISANGTPSSSLLRRDNRVMGYYGPKVSLEGFVRRLVDVNYIQNIHRHPGRVCSPVADVVGLLAMSLPGVGPVVNRHAGVAP